MTMFSRLRKLDRDIGVAITGAGFIGRGLIYQIEQMPGMKVRLVVNRTCEKAVKALIHSGRDPQHICVSDDIEELQAAICRGDVAVTSDLRNISELDGFEVVVEATGAVEYGARVAMLAIERGRHVVMMNAETDATVGCALKRRADDAGVVYSNADGDQPAVLKRLVDFVEGMGLDIVAAVNCKGFMDVYATPDSIRPWAEKQNTSLQMTTSLTDGTKMNIENAVLANATGLVPDKRGMHGIQTTLARAIDDCVQQFDGTGLVDYTLGGDFGGGVFIIGRGDDPEIITPYMRYLKMGHGPHYLFYRHFHLCHYETPWSIAEAALDAEPTIAPIGDPVAEVITIAKRDLVPGDHLDGIGGFDCFGQIETRERSHGCLPIGLAEGCRVVRSVRRDQPVPMNAVELDENSLLVKLWREQCQTTVLAARRSA